MNKFEICAGNYIELIKSDEFFFDKFSPGDVFKIVNIKSVLDDNIIAISSVGDCSITYYLSENTIQQYFKPVASSNDSGENKDNEEDRIITVDNSFLVDVLDGARIKIFNVFDKCTIVAVRLNNGFVLVESSNCFDHKDKFSDVGIELCLYKITDKIMEHEAYSQYEFADITYEYKGDFISGNDGAKIESSLNENNELELDFDVNEALRLTL